MTSNDIGSDFHHQDSRASGLRLAAGAIGHCVRSKPWGAVAQITIAIAMGTAPLGAAWSTKLLVDGLVEGPEIPWVALLGLGTATLCLSLLPPLERWVTAEAKRAIRYRCQAVLYEAIARLRGLRQLENPRFHNQLRIAQTSGEDTPFEVTQACIGILQGGVTLLGFLISVASINWIIGLLVLVAAIPALFCEASIAKQRAHQEMFLSGAERRRMFYQELIASVRAAKELRLFGLSTFFRQKMLNELSSIDKDRRRLDSREGRWQSGLALLSVSVGLAALAWTVLTVGSSKAMGVGDLLVLLAAIPGSQAAIHTLVSQGAGVHQSLILFAQFDAIVRDTTPDLPTAQPVETVLPLRDGIELKNVWFRYGPDQPWVLRGVSLFIAAGAATGLVGRNGSGKSTLVKLLCRLYDPDRGCILWDGVDIRRFDVSTYRERLTTVFQDFMEYDLTAAENIALGDIHEDGSEASVRDSAEQAGAHAIIQALPHGYQTPLTLTLTYEDDEDAEGMVLSGGQWQRLALARAYHRRDRDLLILDEPSSGLDAEAEHELHTSMLAYRQGRTSVLVSHRMNSLQEADWLVSLEGGRVAEAGTPRYLLAAGGVYARLFNRQARGFIDADRDDIPRAPTTEAAE